jgi:methylated-DNA-protein-cysteine methyltransferase related protein
MFPSPEEANCFVNMPKKNKIPAKKTGNTLAKPVSREKDNFFADVYDVVRQIPRGRVTSYGAIAAYLGTKSSSRMVGWAMNGAGRIKPKVPAHRHAQW